MHPSNSGFPDVLFGGPDKTGSTWVHQLLTSHSQVYTPATKELFFFNDAWRKGPDWYRDRFVSAAPDQLVVDVCHDYLPSAEFGTRLAAVCPRARVVVGYRDPIERALSSHEYMKLQGRTRGDFGTDLARIYELIDHGRYGQMVTRLLEQHPAVRVSEYRFADLQADPVTFSRHLIQRLGLDSASIDVPPPANTARTARSPRLVAAGRASLRLMRQAGFHEHAARLKSQVLESSFLFRDQRGTGARSPEVQTLQSHLELLRDDLEVYDRIMGTRHRPEFEARWLSTVEGQPGCP